MKKPRLKKRILQHPFTLAVLSWLAALIIRMLYATSRTEKIISHNSLPYVAGEKQGIFCFWHGRMIMFPCVKPKLRAMKVLISHHNDGKIISKIISHFGIETIHGSRSKGGSSALKAAVSAIERGANVAITPDGPRGPRYVAAPGAVWLAQSTGLPIIPVTMSAVSAITLKSWDAFMIPRPFTHIRLYIGEPIEVTHATTQTAIEAARTSMENILQRMTQDADMWSNKITESEHA